MFFCQVEKKNKQNNLNKNLLVSVNCCEEVVMQDCDVRFDFYFFIMNALLCTNKKNYVRIKWSSSLCFAL